jgi:hypothetical protein
MHDDAAVGRLIWEQIWEQNTAKPIRISATGCNRRDMRPPFTCAFETVRMERNSQYVAHNPEVAGSNPVPATESIRTRRGHHAKPPPAVVQVTLQASTQVSVGSIL